MALKVGPNSGLLVYGNPGEGHYTLLMRQWRWLDFFLNPNVINLTNTPPGSQVDGDAFIVGPAPTGAWGGQANKIARWAGDLDTPAWDFVTPKRGFALVYNLNDNKRYQFNGTAWVEFLSGSGGGGGGGGLVNDILATVTPADTVITTGQSSAFAPVTRAGVITGVKANLKTASSSGLVTVDIKKNGTSILTTLLTIDATELTSLTAATAAVLDAGQTTVAADDILTFHVTGAGTGAKDLVVTVLMQATAPATPNVKSIADASSYGPDYDTDLLKVTALTQAITIPNPTGSTPDGWGLVIRIKSAANQNITWGNQYRAGDGVTLPATTTAGKWTYVNCVWNSDDSKYDVLSVGVSG